MELIRTTSFTKAIAKLKVTEAEIDALETEIATNPQAGDVIQGLRGVRKIRFSMGGKGKRGGGRCIYLVLYLFAAGLWQIETNRSFAKTAQGHIGFY